MNLHQFRQILVTTVLLPLVLLLLLALVLAWQIPAHPAGAAAH